MQPAERGRSGVSASDRSNLRCLGAASYLGRKLAPSSTSLMTYAALLAAGSSAAVNYDQTCTAAARSKNLTPAAPSSSCRQSRAQLIGGLHRGGRAVALQVPAVSLVYGTPRTALELSSPRLKNHEIVAAAAVEKGPYGFLIDFLMGGVSAAVSKTSAAPIERVKLLIQNQDEMIKQGRLSEPYKGVVECFKRTIADEGVGALWRGNLANVIRYFPTQVIIIISLTSLS